MDLRTSKLGGRLERIEKDSGTRVEGKVTYRSDLPLCIVLNVLGQVDISLKTEQRRVT